MVFGIFSRKPAIVAAPADNEHKLIHEPNHRIQQQLRTPSPSIASGSVGNPSNSPTFFTIRPHSNLSPSGNGLLPAISPSPPPTTDPTALQSLLMTIPPKVLHEYTLAQLQETTEPHSQLTLTVLTSFFSALTPPPLLHCARCHKGFFDVENDDRSCMVPHDDESAEVERVGRGAGKAAEYETLWGCCGKTVEGDGDMGPPDGWCYEGKHTTDTKRARFRADSTIHEDRLTSCAKLRCHGLPSGSSVSARNTRKRPRKSMLEESASSSDDDLSEGEPDSGMEEIASAGGKRARRSSSVAASVRSKKSAASKGKRKAKTVDTDPEDVEMSGEEPPQTISSSNSTKPRPQPKPKSTVKPKSSRAKVAAQLPPATPKKTPLPGRSPSTTPRSRAKKNALVKKLSEVADSEEEEKPKKKRKVT